MADEHKGLMAAGAGLAWRRRSILLWILAANIVLSALGTLPAIRQLERSLGHSLAGQQLYKGFDVGMFYELVRVPEVSLLRFRLTSYAFALLFALFMLFVSGGVLEAYRQDRNVDTGEFFAASGAFFWRFVQLTLLSLIPFSLISAAYFDVERASDYLGDRVLADQVGSSLWLVGVVILILLALFVRLWFDIAKVHTVARNEQGMLRTTWKGLDISRRQVRGLLWVYLRISLLAWGTALVAFVIWTKLPPTAIWVTFVVLELVVLVQLSARLWQMASVTAWYRLYAERAYTAQLSVVQPPEMMEPSPQLSLYEEAESSRADGQEISGGPANSRAHQHGELG